MTWLMTDNTIVFFNYKSALFLLLGRREGRQLTLSLDLARVE